MTRISTFLFLWGTVTVACNGAVIKGRPCEHDSGEEIKTEEQVLVNIPEAPMLPPFSSNALEFVAPLQDEIKSETSEATTSLPSVPLSYQPASIVSGDYAWPAASLYPSYPVNVLSGQAALDYPNVQIVPITDITATKPETSQIKEESLNAIPEAPVLPPFEAGMVFNSQLEHKVELPTTPEISSSTFLPSWPALSHYTPNFLPYQQMYGNSRDETFYNQAWSYYPIAPRPCEHHSVSSPAIVETRPYHFENLGAPFYAPALTPETESKPTTNAVATDEAPAKEDTVLLIIPEAPILPPFVAPEMPKEESTPATVSEVEVPTISQNEEVLEAVGPFEKEVELISIPEAPVLPPFVAPELYINVPTTEEPKHEYDEIPKVTETQPIYVSIPEAPVLPAFEAPELHISAEAEVPAKEVNCNEAVPESEPLLVIIPEAPVLPPFTATQALPIAPMNDEPKPEPASYYEEPKEEKYESFVPIVIPTAPVLPQFVAPEIPMEEEKEPLPMSTEAPVATEVLYEEPESEPQQFIPIPTAPLLPTFVAPEVPTQPIYEEQKSENCDKDKEYKPVAASYPYYLPIPAHYALSPQSGVGFPESAQSIAECIRKILANGASPSFYASLVPTAQGLPRAPVVPLSSPFYYKPAMSNNLPVY